MKALRFALIAALVLAAVPAVMADNRAGIDTPTSPSEIAVGGLYDRLLLNRAPADAPPVSLPIPTEPSEFTVSTSDEGMLSLGLAKGSDMSTSNFGAAMGGSAIVSPRGGAMSSPQQLAEREIDRLIRRLH